MNSIEDRALSEHRGSGIFNKKANGKYSLFLPVTGTGENGSAPAQLDKTVIGNAQATSVEGPMKKGYKIVVSKWTGENIMSIRKAVYDWVSARL